MRLSVEQAAERLGLSPATVRRRCVDGSLPAEKVGRAWVVDLDLIPCRSGHTDCSTDCGLCKGTGYQRPRPAPAQAYPPDIYKARDEYYDRYSPPQPSAWDLLSRLVYRTDANPSGWDSPWWVWLLAGFLAGLALMYLVTVPGG